MASVHGIDTAVVGPAFRQIAARYGHDARPAVPDAEARLVAKVRAGGGGVWGTMAMPAQPQVGAGDAQTVVQWILAGVR